MDFLQILSKKMKTHDASFLSSEVVGRGGDVALGGEVSREDLKDASSSKEEATSLWLRGNRPQRPSDKAVGRTFPRWSFSTTFLAKVVSWACITAICQRVKMLGLMDRSGDTDVQCKGNKGKAQEDGMQHPQRVSAAHHSPGLSWTRVEEELMLEDRKRWSESYPGLWRASLLRDPRDVLDLRRRLWGRTPKITNLYHLG